jgi:DNA-binding NarL/FixJ family response regulator
MASTLLIVDDDPSFLAAARQLLEAEGFTVVGEALTGREGVSAASELRPDLVLLDVNLPDIDGFEVLAEIGRGADSPPVVLTSTREASDFGGLIESSGARAFISKGDLSGPALAPYVDSPASP